jgi:hypothetical protein
VKLEMMNEHRSADTNQAAKPRATSGNTILDFCVGAVGWFAINTLFWGAIGLMSSSMGPGAIIIVPLVFVPGPANLVALVLLLARPAWRWMALGVFSAFVVNSIGLLVSDPEPPLIFFKVLSMFPFFLLHRLGL